MSKQIYIDSNGNEIQVSGTVNTADLMPMSGNDSTKVSEAIGSLSTLTTTDKSSIVGAVNEVDGKTIPQLISSANNIYIYEMGKIVCVGLYNATVDNVISALSRYTTNNNIIRFVVWNATTVRVNLVSIGTSILVIDTNPWGAITGSDPLNGGFTFLKV